MKSVDLTFFLPEGVEGEATLRTQVLRHTDLLSPSEAILSTAERMRVRQLISRDKQKNLLQSLCALRMALSDCLSLAPGDIRIAHNEHGAPFLPDCHALNISVSRTIGWTGIALVSGRRIGLDIEQLRDLDWHLMIPMICDEDEAGEMRNLLASDPCMSHFFRLWTTKEAILKATGQGFGFGARRVVIPPEIVRGEVSSGEVVIDETAYHVSCFKQDDLIGALATTGD